MAKNRFIKNTWRKLMPVIIPPVGEIFIRIVWLTMRRKVIGLDALRAELLKGRGLIIAFWHGRMLMLPPFFERYVQREAHVLISQHRDGELITRTINRFGIDSIRGSSTRGGVEAMVGMKAKIAEGAIIGITPDGPKGPLEEARRGVIELAHMTGAPIFTLSCAAGRMKKMGSWDRFNVHAPFSKLVFIFGEPMRLTGNEGLEGREAMRVELERRMIDGCKEAERLAGWKGDAAS